MAAKTRQQRNRERNNRRRLVARRLPVIEYQRGRSSTSVVSEVMTYESRCGRYRISRSKLTFEKGEIVYHALRKIKRADGAVSWSLVDSSRATQRLRSRARAELLIRRHAATLEDPQP